VTFAEFMRRNAEKFSVTAFQKGADGRYLVHVTENTDKASKCQKLFDRVPAIDLANFLRVDLKHLEKERNVHVLEAERSRKVFRDDLLP
jgi:hypothetical protein